MLRTGSFFWNENDVIEILFRLHFFKWIFAGADKQRLPGVPDCAQIVPVKVKVFNKFPNKTKNA